MLEELQGVGRRPGRRLQADPLAARRPAGVGLKGSAYAVSGAVPERHGGRMFQGWSVKAKLMASALVTTLGVVTLAGFNVYSGRANSQALERVYERNVRSLIQLQKLDGLVREVRFRAAGVLLDIVSVQGSLNHVREAQKELDGIWTSMDRSPGVLDEEQRALLGEMENGWSNVLTILSRIELAYMSKNNGLLAILDTEWAEVHKTFIKPMEKLVPLKEREA